MSELWWMNIELMIRMSIRSHMIRYNIHGCHFMFLFPFHATILEPDLNLSLRQAQGMGNLYSSSTCQISIEMKLLLQFKGLIAGVWGTLSFCFTICIHCTCIIIIRKKKKNRKRKKERYGNSQQSDSLIIYKQIQFNSVIVVYITIIYKQIQFNSQFTSYIDTDYI